MYQISGTESFKNSLKKDLKQIEENDAYKNKEEKFSTIIDPIVADFKTGNTDKALKVINGYIYNDSTDPELKNALKEIKETIEERVTKSGAPISKAPTLYTINGIGSKIYGDTLYFVFFFIPIFPIARYKLDKHGDSYSFYGKLELHKWQNIWKIIAILIIIYWIIYAMSSS